MPRTVTIFSFIIFTNRDNFSESDKLSIWMCCPDELSNVLHKFSGQHKPTSITCLDKLSRSINKGEYSSRVAVLGFRSQSVNQRCDERRLRWASMFASFSQHHNTFVTFNYHTQIDLRFLLFPQWNHHYSIARYIQNLLDLSWSTVSTTVLSRLFHIFTVQLVKENVLRS